MPWDQIQPWLVNGGIPAVAVIGVLFGWLVPARTVAQMRADLIVWRATAETALAANKELAEHVGRLVVTSEKLIEAQRETEALVRAFVTTTSTRSMPVALPPAPLLPGVA